MSLYTVVWWNKSELGDVVAPHTEDLSSPEN